LKERGYKCLFFINGPQRDVDFVNTFKNYYGIPSNKFLSNDVTRDGKLFLSTLSQFSLVISSRLHTSICCYSLKIPTLSLSWDKKINEFYGNIGREQWILGENDICKISEKIENALTLGYDANHYDVYNNTVKHFLKMVLNQR
jgi:exopolysaccharide biosynthesis predicted pyruvyltransferase EpsI